MTVEIAHSQLSIFGEVCGRGGVRAVSTVAHVHMYVYGIIAGSVVKSCEVAGREVAVSK